MSQVTRDMTPAERVKLHLLGLVAAMQEFATGERTPDDAVLETTPYRRQILAVSTEDGNALIRFGYGAGNYFDSSKVMLDTKNRMLSEMDNEGGVTAFLRAARVFDEGASR